MTLHGRGGSGKNDGGGHQPLLYQCFPAVSEVPFLYWVIPLRSRRAVAQIRSGKICIRTPLVQRVIGYSLSACRIRQPLHWFIPSSGSELNATYPPLQSMMLMVSNVFLPMTGPTVVVIIRVPANRRTFTSLLWASRFEAAVLSTPSIARSSRQPSDRSPVAFDQRLEYCCVVCLSSRLLCQFFLHEVLVYMLRRSSDIVRSA
ncbi:hypothetical protein BKA93DRAFT_810764 [Sparassis latifolia]